MGTVAEIDKIARKLRDRELILFVGSGMSAGCYPTWSRLLEELMLAAGAASRCRVGDRGPGR